MDFTQSIQACAASLRRTPVNLQSGSMNDLATITRPPQPLTKPKPVPRTGNRINSGNFGNSPQAVQRDKLVPQVKEKPDKKQLAVGEALLKNTSKAEANQPVAIKPKPYSSPALPVRTSSIDHIPHNIIYASRSKPPAVPIRNSTTSPLGMDDDDEEDTYDDIRVYQDSLKSSSNQRSENDVDLPSPPPLPPPNAGAMKKSVSCEKLNRIRTNNTYATHYISATLPDQRKKGSPMLKKPIPDTQSPTIFGQADYDYEAIGGPMGMREFVNKYQCHFPMQIKICSSHDGVISVKQGDIYNVHFLKNTDVVYLTANGSVQYIVPLNSAVEFGVLYNPTSNFQNAMQGYLFATVGEIMMTGYVPPIMCAQQTCGDVSSQESSVQDGDVLIIHEVKKPKLRNKILLCTDVQTEQKKRLTESCSGNFSTTPSQIKLFLPQLLRYIPLPQYCMLFYNGRNAQEIKLPRDIVEITRTTTQQSIIVSKHMSNELMEFPLSNNIIVQAIQPNKSSSQHLMEVTKEKYETFNPINVNSTSMMLSFENPYTLSKQVTLFSCIRQDNPFVGVKLVAPKYMSSHSLPALPTVSSQILNNGDVQVEEDDYQLPDVAFADFNKTAQKKLAQDKSHDSQDKSHYDSPKSNKSIAPDDDDEEVYDIPCTPMPKKIGVAKSHHTRTQPHTEEGSLVSKEVNDLKNEISSLKATVDKLDKLCKRFSVNIGMFVIITNNWIINFYFYFIIANLQSELKSVRVSASAGTSKDIPNTPEANISFLQSLNCQQVSGLPITACWVCCYCVNHH